MHSISFRTCGDFLFAFVLRTSLYKAVLALHIARVEDSSHFDPFESGITLRRLRVQSQDGLVCFHEVIAKNKITSTWPNVVF